MKKIKLPFIIANDFKNKHVKHMTGDFETCKTPDLSDVRVWAWGLADIDNYNFEHGTTIDGFMNRILSNNDILDIGFHNLKFDGNFIIPQLYKMGYKYLDGKTFRQRWEQGEDLSRTFTHSITIMGQWFSITIVKDTFATAKTPAFVHIWDTNKLFTSKLKEVGKQYCKTYKKLDEDDAFYEQIRPLDHQLTDDEYKYLRNDCLVLAEALKSELARYGKIYRTKASKAFSFFKECCINEYADYNYYQMKYVGLKQHVVPYIEDMPDLEGAIFNYLPSHIREVIRKRKIKMSEEYKYHIKNYEQWIELKASYRGGISFVNPKIKEQSITDKIMVLDVNSMYPSVLRNKPLPFGRMVKREGEPPKDKMWIACARVSFRLKHDYNLPCIQIKELYGRDWLAESTDYMQRGRATRYNEDYLTFTSVDYETFCENYNFVVHEWLWYYEFATFDNEDGKRFVDKYYKAKQDADHIIEKVKKRHNNIEELYEQDEEYIKAMLDRFEAKLILNSAYGKFGTRYILASQDSYFDEELKMVKFTGDVINFEKEPEDPSHFYLPYASFVTSYARQMLVRGWNSFKGKALYCDTDSLHIRGDKDAISDELAPFVDWEKTGELGLWKIEGEFDKGRYIRAKTYIEIGKKGDKEKVNIVCAGATDAVKEVMTWENFRVGFDAWRVCEEQGLDPKQHSKLKPKQYPSGVDLVHENFQIKPNFFG